MLEYLEHLRTIDLAFRVVAYLLIVAVLLGITTWSLTYLATAQHIQWLETRLDLALDLDELASIREAADRLEPRTLHQAIQLGTLVVKIHNRSCELGYPE